MRRLGSAAFGLVLASLLSCQNVPATATPAPSGAQTGGIVRVAIPGEVTSLDPWNADDPSLVATRQIFDTLVTVDAATGKIGPGLASSWQASNDGASWTFTLHDGVRVPDGSSLGAPAGGAGLQRGRASRYRLPFGDPPGLPRHLAVRAPTSRCQLHTAVAPLP